MSWKIDIPVELTALMMKAESIAELLISICKILSEKSSSIGFGLREALKIESRSKLNMWKFMSCELGVASIVPPILTVFPENLQTESPDPSFGERQESAIPL